MQNIKRDNSQIFHDVNVDECLNIFDEVTNQPSSLPTHEEFQEIQGHWLNIPQEEFEREENNILEWAAVTL